jgi:hypothetical protein
VVAQSVKAEGTKRRRTPSAPARRDQSVFAIGARSSSFKSSRIGR